MDTETITINYSSIKAALAAGGESYLQMTIQGTYGGGAPTIQDCNNAELTTLVPEPATLALAGLGWNHGHGYGLVAKKVGVFFTAGSFLLCKTLALRGLSLTFFISAFRRIRE